MRRVLRILKLSALGCVGLVIVIVAVALSARAYFKHSNAEAIAIQGPNGIDEAMFVEIGGIDQWIQIRGQDRKNPAVLLLNGGPGASWIRATQTLTPWEEYFVFVQWDQRGAGKTLRRNGEDIVDTMSIDQMVRDSIEVAEYVTTFLEKDKIIVLGHSWGSILGVHLAKERPDLLYSYVGAGQVGNLAADFQHQYDRLTDAATASQNSRIIERLGKLGPPPYASFEEYGQLFQLSGLLFSRGGPSAPLLSGALTAPSYSLLDYYYLLRGFRISQDALFPAAVRHDLRSLGPDFEIPMFVIHGAADDQAPLDSAREYFDWISAPQKQFIEIPGGHFAFLIPGTFLNEMVMRVRPLAISQ